MKDTDIVTALYVLNHHAKKLAENESLHDLYREAFTRCETLTWKAAKEIERLRKERDEARRLYCIAFQEITENLGEKNTTESIAEEMGWDCFKENTDA